LNSTTRVVSRTGTGSPTLPSRSVTSPFVSSVAKDSSTDPW
jgi:hypothetical protein